VTNHLIHQLDLSWQAKQLNDESLKLYASLFKGPLAAKSITAIRTVTWLADD
jgi:hypothetical protein